MQKRVTTLRKFMLPSKFSPTGLYPDRVHQRAAAFRLLVHAEFESCLEDIVMRHLTSRVNDWRVSGKPSITIAALFAYDDSPGKPPTSLLTPPQKPAALFDDRLDNAVARYNHQVRVFNHGVRESNVLGMILPIGFDAARLDTAWLADLDAWASERGDLAHQSTGKVKIKLDPAREYMKVKDLLAGFRSLDQEISRLA